MTDFFQSLRRSGDHQEPTELEPHHLDPDEKLVKSQKDENHCQHENHDEQRLFAIKLKKANDLLAEGEIDKSIIMYTDLMDEFPSKPLIYYNMALALMEKDNYPLSLKLFQHLPTIGFDDSRVWIGIGYCHLKEGRHEEALANFSKVAEDQTGYIESLIGKVYTLVLASRHPEVYPLLLLLKEKGVWNQELELIFKMIRKLPQNQSNGTEYH